MNQLPQTLNCRVFDVAESLRELQRQQNLGRLYLPNGEIFTLELDTSFSEMRNAQSCCMVTYLMMMR